MKWERTIFVGPRVVGRSFVFQGNIEQIPDQRERFRTGGQRILFSHLAPAHNINRHHTPERDESRESRRERHGRGSRFLIEGGNLLYADSVFTWTRTRRRFA